MIEDAFDGCVSLKQITLPSSLVELGGFTFYGCESLESITIPSKLRVMARHTFDGCVSLKQIHLPASLEEIEYRLFADCANLERITVDVSNTKFKSDGNCLLSKDGKTLYEGSNASVIPDGVEIINGNAFAGRKGLKDLILPESLKIIEGSAFYGCDGLTEVVLPANLERLDSHAFRDCANLEFNVQGNVNYLGSADNPHFALISATTNQDTSYEIHQDTKIIGGHAFDGCYKFQNTTLPDGVIFIGSFAFGSTALKEVSVGNSLKYIDVFAFYSSPITKFEFRGLEEEWNLIDKHNQWSDGMPDGLTIDFKGN